jgi:hypothetical protein
MVAPTAPMQVVGEGTSRPDDGEEQLRTNANALLTNLAPLEATSETGYPGEARVRVRFNVVLKPKTEAGPEGDA